MPASRTVLLIAIAFFAGGFASRMLPNAEAQSSASAALQAQIIDIGALDEADLGPIIPNTDLRSKLLVVTDKATIAVQQGNVGKHYHEGNDEIQYILSGTGTMWVGDTQRAIKPGDLIVIPKGTNHAGTVATSGRFKAIAIKIPPQAAGDTHFVP
jgi:mannose-6-phosphate isomerase-like protein (cupin superfamily)